MLLHHLQPSPSPMPLPRTSCTPCQVPPSLQTSEQPLHASPRVALHPSVRPWPSIFPSLLHLFPHPETSPGPLVQPTRSSSDLVPHDVWQGLPINHHCEACCFPGCHLHILHDGLKARRLCNTQAWGNMAVCQSSQGPPLPSSSPNPSSESWTPLLPAPFRTCKSLPGPRPSL